MDSKEGGVVLSLGVSSCDVDVNDTSLVLLLLQRKKKKEGKKKKPLNVSSEKKKI